MLFQLAFLPIFDKKVPGILHGDLILNKGQFMSLPSVGIVGFQGINPFLFSIPHCIFGLELPQKLFEVHIAGMEGGALSMDAHVSICADAELADMAAMDIIVVPGWPDLEQRPGEELEAALRKAHDNGSLVVGLCYGAYALAYSGLLDGREATTHWLAEEDFRNRFPKTRLNGNSLYVEDGGIITSAGSAAGIDCCIYVINKIYGFRTANAAARLMVSSPYRDGGQAQFMDFSERRQGMPNINAITEFLQCNIKNEYTLNELAAKFAMSRRTLIRRFEAATGMSVKKWLTCMRLNKCCELLESTDWSMEKIAEETGFGSPGLLRHHFIRCYNIPPKRWRERFFNGQAQAGGTDPARSWRNQ